MKSSANCFGVMLQAAASAAIAFLAGGNSSAESKMLSRLWPLTAGAQGSPSVKTSPFLFLGPGSREECFSLKLPRRKRQHAGVPARRGRKARRQESPRSPSPLGAFAVGCGRTFPKEVQK
jgi:hypothetical protein